MANVLFKQGTQASLDQLHLSKGASKGTFYLTNDSHRLYIGVDGGGVASVNEGVSTVETMSNLPKNVGSNPLVAGQFYYVKDGNILCVFNGTNWVQINPNTDTYIESLEYKVKVSENKAVIDFEITNNSDGASKKDSFSIKGASGVQITSSGKEITIEGDKYEISAEAESNSATISLTSEKTDNDTSVEIKSSGSVEISQHSDGRSILISGTDTKVESFKVQPGSSAVDSSPEKEGIYFEIKETGGRTLTAHLDPIFNVGSTQSEYEQVKIQNGTVSLPVYSKREIDKKLMTLDAMTYKGTVGQGGTFTEIAADNLSIGDTFLVVSQTFSQTIAANNLEIEAKKGDLLICRGTEDPSSGKITSVSLAIDVIPAGDDAKQDTTYEIAPKTNGFVLKAFGGADSGSFTVEGDNSFIEITDRAVAKGNSVIISHKKITEEDTNAATSAGPEVSQTRLQTMQIPVITEVVRDAAGHVKDVKTKTYTVTDTNAVLQPKTEYSTLMASGDVNKVTVASAVSLKGSDGSDKGISRGTFAIDSSSIKISANEGTVSLNLEWGTF